MHLTRRAALLGGLSLPIAALLRGPSVFAAAAGPWPSPLLIAVTGVDAKTAVSRLDAVLEPFTSRELAVAIGIDPIGAAGSTLNPGSTLAEALRNAADTSPHLVELAIHLRSLTEAPYFALRRASEAQAAFTWALNPRGDYTVQDMLTAATLITDAPPGAPEDHAGFRAAGIRTIVHVADSETKDRPEDGSYWITATGLAKVVGSERTSTAGNAPGPIPVRSIADHLRRRSADRRPIVLRVELDSLHELADADLNSYASELADAIAALRDSGSIRSLIPFTLYTQTRQGPVRYVIVRVDDYRLFPLHQAAHEQFSRGLLAAGVPLTEAVIPSGGRAITADADARAYLTAQMGKPGFDIALHGLDHSPHEMLGLTPAHNVEVLSTAISEMYRAVGTIPRTFIPPENLFDGRTLRALGSLGVPMLSAEQGDYRWIWGLDAYGVMHLSNTVSFEKEWTGETPYFETAELLKFLGPRNDAVLMLHPQTVNSPERAKRVKDLVGSLAAEPGTELVNFAGYYKAVSTEMPALTLLQSARSRTVVEETSPSLTSAETRAFEQDAEVAWQYFDRWNKKRRSVVPSTAWLDGGELAGYPFVTMWDVASIIMAHIAVNRMGIIDGDRFEKAMTAVVKFLHASNYRFKGAVLPDAERPIDKSTWERRGFDSADVGRLLIALRALDQYSAQSMGIGKLVDSWGLAATIVDGQMCDVRARRATSVQESSYAHYAARGYRLWDVSVAPVFDTPYAPDSMDAAMHVLAEAQRRGRIATEPHTTEEIELGKSLAATTMADVLFAAQMRRYSETGIPTCVSEGPTDAAPWFTYQGYQLGPDGGIWVVDAPTSAGKAAIDRRPAAFRQVSTKGCFLWAATRPGPYSTMLLELARQKGRTDGFGFASGINEATQKGAAHSDVNTNGIILEAISYILNGRVPLVGTGET